MIITDNYSDIQLYAKVSTKKISNARKVYDTFCRLSSIAEVCRETGLNWRTVKKYIALIEQLNNKNRISTKDRYYSTDTDIKEGYISSPPCSRFYDTAENKICQENNLINIETDTEINTGDIEVIKAETAEEAEVVITNNEELDLKGLKKNLFIEKLKQASNIYVDVLINADENKIKRTSLKDIAIIAGVLTDKQIQLEHKQAANLTNQGIIINLFNTNKGLSEFITDSMKRRQALIDRPIKKYTQER
jgi:hypothetical protein